MPRARFQIWTCKLGARISTKQTCLFWKGTLLWSLWRSSWNILQTLRRVSCSMVRNVSKLILLLIHPSLSSLFSLLSFTFSVHPCRSSLIKSFHLIVTSSISLSPYIHWSKRKKKSLPVRLSMFHYQTRRRRAKGTAHQSMKEVAGDLKYELKYNKRRMVV